MSTSPVLIFDGPDGTGKTTQSLILCSWYYRERQRRVAYCSLPVYEFPYGKVLGRCLKRWGAEQSVPLATPEDMAVLFALNRLETLPYLNLLLDRNYLLVMNRGPYANLFSVARKVLAEGISWQFLSPEGKRERVDKILSLDDFFISELEQRSGGMENIFLFLKAEDSMRLAKARAEATLGAEPDEHERRRDLQELTGQIYKEVAEGGIPAHHAELVEATVGSMRRRYETQEEAVRGKETDGIYQTALSVLDAITRMNKRREREGGKIGLQGIERDEYYYIFEAAEEVFFQTDRGKGLIPFDFRELTKGIEIEVDPEIRRTMEGFISDYPNVREAIEVSRKIDEGQISVSRERER